MLKISLEQWRMFHAVVEFGGFNQASQGVHKSQSSIHNAVRKIEESLGVKLFTIEGRKTVLTEAGEMILRRSDYLIQEAKKVEAIGETLRQGIETQLKIAVDEIFPRVILYKALEKVSTQFPLVQIELNETILGGAIELLENDDVEISIAPSTSKAGFSESLCHINFVAVASPNHPLSQADKDLTLEELKKYRQIVVRDSSHSSKRIRASEGWLKADQRWTVSHLHTSIDMIRSGLGFAWVPLNLIESELKEGRLQTLRLAQHSQRSTQLHLSYKDIDWLGPVARCLLSELKKNSVNLPIP